DACGCLFLLPSRRRHTRSKRDWSSDVCSSDLQDRRYTYQPRISLATVYFYDMEAHSRPNWQRDGTDGQRISDILKGFNRLHRQRSEERRVGKEWRAVSVGDEGRTAMDQSQRHS